MSVKDKTMQWIKRGDENQLPTVSGWYRVMVSGDSESIDGHTIYDYPDYETWAWFEYDNDEETGIFTGSHDEETDMIFAYCGPFEVPKYVK